MFPNGRFSGEPDVKPASNIYSVATRNCDDNDGDELGDLESRGESEGRGAATALGCAHWTKHHGPGKIVHAFQVKKMNALFAHESVLTSASVQGGLVVVDLGCVDLDFSKFHCHAQLHSPFFQTSCSSSAMGPVVECPKSTNPTEVPDHQPHPVSNAFTPLVSFSYLPNRRPSLM